MSPAKDETPQGVAETPAGNDAGGTHQIQYTMSEYYFGPARAVMAAISAANINPKRQP